jgi:mannose-1-phosphate guanylyltransferase
VRAFLLAAGFGTRLGEMTRTTPKCLLPVGGRPLIDLWFDRLAAAGVERVLLNTHHLAERVRDHVATTRPPLEVELFHEDTLLGSAGTLAANRAFVADGEPFLVVYADNASTVDLRQLTAALRPGDAAALGLFRVEDPRSAGIVELDPDGRVLGFEEKPEHPRSDLAWAGLLVATEALIEAIPDGTPRDLGREVLPRLAGRMRGVEIEGYHRDVGTPESYARVCADFESLGVAE